MPTDLGQATLVAQLPDTTTAALKADATQALTVADATARTLLASIITYLDAMATLGETQPVSVASIPLPAGAATQATLAAILAALATVPVTGPLTDAQLRAASIAVTGPLTDVQLRASKVTVADDYQAGEVLADQNGAGTVLTFTFSSAVQLVVVHARGAGLVARSDAFGGTPNVSQGIVCGDDVPTYIPVNTASVKVFAPAGMVVTVHGMRRT